MYISLNASLPTPPVNSPTYFLVYSPMYLPVYLPLYPPYVLPHIFPLEAPKGIHLAYSSFRVSASKSKTVFDLAVCCCKGLTAYDDKHAYCRFASIMTKATGKVIHEINSDM